MEHMKKDAFPQAHTCFFQLDIPNYETDEMAYNRLKGAIEMCGSVDADMRNVADESEWNRNKNKKDAEVQYSSVI